MNGPFPHPDHIAAIHKRIVEAAGEGGAPDFSTHHVATHVAEVYGNMPHPQVPSLLIKDYPSHERVAWMLNDRKPLPHEVAQAAETLKQAGLSPSQFESTWAIARPVANRLLGTDPTMQQLVALQGGSPQDIHHYYMNHPFPGYEEVTAGEMVRGYRAAEHVARQYGQVPNHEEVSRFVATGASSDDMHNHYSESG
jgi:hypothetical protein